MKTYSEGEMLKILRERFNPPRGTTQDQVARQLGFSKSFIYAVLAGSQPITERLASVLGYREHPRVFSRKQGGTQ